MKVIKKLRRYLGNVYRALTTFTSQPPRISHDASLRLLSHHLQFATVYDAGAADGVFTRLALRLWPDANYVLFEPLESLYRLENTFKGSPNVHVVASAVLESQQQVEINVHPDLYGSSVYKEVEGALVDGYQISVPATTLNRFVEGSGHQLVKLDLKGAELRALDGGNLLFERQSEGSETIFIVEVGIFDTMLGSANTFANTVSYFRERHFVLYDLAGIMYRPLDGAAAQLDLVFCHEKSVLRKDHRYAFKEQRLRQFGEDGPNLSVQLPH